MKRARRILTKQTYNRHILYMDEEISKEYLEELEDFEKENYRMDDLFADINTLTLGQHGQTWLLRETAFPPF